MGKITGALLFLSGSSFVLLLQSRTTLYDGFTSTRGLAPTLGDSSVLLPDSCNNKPTYDKVEYEGYVPASTEEYVVKQAVALGYNGRLPAGCPIWLDANQTTPSIFADLVQYREDLKEYNKRVQEFSFDIKDLRLRIAEDSSHEVCKTVDLHPDGIQGIFSKSRQVSYTASGFVEPLLPPMRHPDFCERGEKSVLDLNYLVHDFGNMCRQLKPTSRIVLFDLGASLQFHKGDNPALEVIDLFTKFGFPFDHIYSYEVTKTEAAVVFDSVPRHLLPAYHWINVGVNTTVDSPLNPWTGLLDKYNPDDLVIFKLDIDTPHLEIPLAEQLLGDERLAKLVDQFYFEHHVAMKEMHRYWRRNVRGNVKTTLDLFYGLREKGVPAHFWV
jgi:hypothetical protein